MGGSAAGARGFVDGLAPGKGGVDGEEALEREDGHLEEVVGDEGDDEGERPYTASVLRSRFKILPRSAHFPAKNYRRNIAESAIGRPSAYRLNQSSATCDVINLIQSRVPRNW